MRYSQINGKNVIDFYTKKHTPQRKQCLKICFCWKSMLKSLRNLVISVDVGVNIHRTWGEEVFRVYWNHFRWTLVTACYCVPSQGYGENWSGSVITPTPRGDYLFVRKPLVILVAGREVVGPVGGSQNGCLGVSWKNK